MERYPGGKHYYTYDTAMKQRFGEKMIKLSLNAGFTCPNRDGTKAFGGCSFCTSSGSGDFAGNASCSVLEQLKSEAARMKQKWENESYIAYFQANSNTHTKPKILLDKCREALCFPGVRGITLATRADCLPQPILDALIKLKEETHLTVELGLQTVSDATAAKLNRGHTFKEFLTGYRALKTYSIPVTVHLINGLPGETIADMMHNARVVAALLPNGVKLHMLHVMEETALGEKYKTEPFPLLTLEEYAALIADQITVFSKETVIERVTGDGDRNKLIAPEWTVRKRAVLGAIDRSLRDRDLWQGDCFNPDYPIPE